MSIINTHVEHSRSNGAGDRITAVRVEIHGLSECLSYMWLRHNCAEWKTVADTFGHDDDVGIDPVTLKAPEMFAGSGETGLNLVGDA